MQFTEAAAIALKQYEQGNVHITPIYPGILIRVLPKPAFFGNLLLPEAYRNKPVYEGIVLKTYKPRTVMYKDSRLTLESELKPGDHICFPYWSGMPVPKLDENEYRVIPDHSYFNQHKPDSGEPFMKLEYPSASIHADIRSEIESIVIDNGGDIHFDASDYVKDLLSKYDIIRKDQTSKLEYIQPTKPD